MKARENPFRVERLHRLKFLFPDGTMENFLKKIERTQFRGAIVGPHGAGKTTLIEEVMCEFRERGISFSHLRLRDDGKRVNHQRILNWLAETPQSAVLILDSAGLLNWWAWRNVSRNSKHFAGLIISTHQTGRLPTLIECTPTVETFMQLVENLELAFDVPQSHLVKTFTHCKGNIRDCLRTLYDEFATVELEELRGMKSPN